MKLAIPYSLSFLSVLLIYTLGISQNTIGLLDIKPKETFEGYNLIYPHNQPNVYLLDQCGEIVHTWTDADNFRPGNGVYLLPDGTLIKTKRDKIFLNDPIWAGGGGAFVEVRNWNNQLLSSFELNDSLFRLHHDVAPMPNGNILMIAWERRTKEEAVSAGRDTALLSQDQLWGETILEWDPQLDRIVWRWSVWDHLIQDYDDTKDNFGVVGDHPELININYDEHNGHPDWLHINAIDYNPVLDQIALSVPYFNEMWVLDHSTTPEESAGHTGGNAGKGGDLLFRWGNPAAYNQGGLEDKRFFFQHDVHWVDPLATPADTAFGYIAAYNNRTPDMKSPGQIVDSEVIAESATYPFDGKIFGAPEFVRTLFYPGDEIRTNSASVSSVQFLPNGNALLLAGRWGYAYELNPSGEVVWEYIVPIQNGSPATQGDTIGIGDNLTFRMTRYAVDYPAFEGRDLSPQGYLELEPNEALCNLLLPTEDKQLAESTIRIYPNPARTSLTITQELESQEVAAVSLHDLSGRLVERIPLTGIRTTVAVGHLPAGVYLIRGKGMVAKKMVIVP